MRTRLARDLVGLRPDGAGWSADRPGLRERARRRLDRMALRVAKGVLEDSPEALVRTLHRGGRAFTDSEIPFAVGGGAGRWIRGGPQVTHDIDFLVRPENADHALETLMEIGMRPGGISSWGRQVWDGSVEVDLIWSPAGLEVTDQLLRRGDMFDIDGLPLRVVALEDDLVSKLLAITERAPNYKDVLVAARSLREQVNWDEVRERTRESAFAAAFFTIADGLGVTERPIATYPRAHQLDVPGWVEQWAPSATRNV